MPTVGTAERLSVVFRDADDVIGDPSEVSLHVLDPNGTETIYTYPDEITRTGTGAYRMAVLGTIAGEWEYYWQGSGGIDVTSAGSVRFTALPF